MAKRAALMFKKGDVLAVMMVVIAAVAVALCFLPGKGGGETAGVYMDGALIMTLDLREDGVFTAQGIYNNEITVSGGSVSITASDCPGNDCVHTGGISAAGRSIVCLPNRLEIRISDGEYSLDAVVR